jgi:hypothetical protein
VAVVLAMVVVADAGAVMVVMVATVVMVVDAVQLAPPTQLAEKTPQ